MRPCCEGHLVWWLGEGRPVDISVRLGGILFFPFMFSMVIFSWFHHYISIITGDFLHVRKVLFPIGNIVCCYDCIFCVYFLKPNFIDLEWSGESLKVNHFLLGECLPLKVDEHAQEIGGQSLALFISVSWPFVTTLVYLKPCTLAFVLRVLVSPLLWDEQIWRR